MRTYIIAEIGVNHNGKLSLAKEMIDKASECGVDCVKFQTYKSENLVSSCAKMADYQVKNTNHEESQLQMLKKLELSYPQFEELKVYCEKKNVQFLSTPFDFESIDFLNQLSVPFWKIPSSEITNYPYLKKISQTHKDIVLSTGMSTLEEVAAALGVLRKNGSENISLLHCVTEYPTPFNQVNLRAMNTLRATFNLPVGYSDHTMGIEVPIAAVAMGAVIIEKHFTLDNNLPGPDHKASLMPVPFKAMVDCIRNIELAIGDGAKVPCECEIKNIAVARKSIIAKTDIKKGEEFSEDNITVKRPGNGVSPMKWENVIGKKAIKDFSVNELIQI